jgi:hypothetical protein
MKLYKSFLLVLIVLAMVFILIPGKASTSCKSAGKCAVEKNKKSLVTEKNVEDLKSDLLFRY